MVEQQLIYSSTGLHEPEIFSTWVKQNGLGISHKNIDPLLFSIVPRSKGRRNFEPF
jgi:hypothetical protein